MTYIPGAIAEAKSSVLDRIPKDTPIHIVRTRWNPEIVNALVSGCRAQLEKRGMTHVVETTVSGCFELPYAAKIAIEKKAAAVVAIGVLIKGSTPHFDYIADATTHGLMKVQLTAGAPVIFGVLTCNTKDQAEARAGIAPDSHNHGTDWADAALEQIALRY